jgi:hypothetical protein
MQKGMLCFLYYIQLGGVILVQYIARMSLLWLIRILLVLGLISSFPPPWSGSLTTTKQEHTSPEIEHYERKFTPPVRTAPKMIPQIGAIKIFEQWGQRTIALTAILPILSIIFRPVIYKFMLRLRLYVLKFTSHFVALHPTQFI